MGMGEADRRLAAILVADVIGYSAMVGADEDDLGCLSDDRSGWNADVEVFAAPRSVLPTAVAQARVN
jgi:hypothetical protein